MTPCEVLGYKVGDTFRIIDGFISDIMESEFVKLHADTRDDSPLFITEIGIKHHINLKSVVKLVTQDSMKPTNIIQPDMESDLGQLFASRKSNLEQIKQLEIENAKIWEEIQKIAKESGLGISEQNKQTEQAEEVVEEQDSEDWIEWKGGNCPVEKGTLVDVRYRDGTVLTNLQALIRTDGVIKSAAYPFWVHDDHNNDIMFYRLSK